MTFGGVGTPALLSNVARVGGVLIVILGASLFWVAHMGRQRADPKNLVGMSSLTGGLIGALPERFWAAAVSLLGCCLVVFGIALAVAG